MAANVTNLVQAHALNTGAMTLAAVAGADQAFPAAGGSNVGIDGVNACQQLENAGTSLVTDDFYSGYVTFSSLSMSAVDSAFVVHFKNNQPSFNSIKAVRIAIRSGTGTANWGVWNTSGLTTLKNGSFHPCVATGTPDIEIGTFDPSDCTGFALLVQASNTDTFGLQISVDQLVHINGPVVFEDTGTAATVTLENYFDLLKPTSGTTYHSMLVARAGPTIEFGFPISIQADDYDDTSIALGIAFKPADGVGFPAMPLGYFQLGVIGQASGSIVLSNASLATNSTAYNLTVNGAAASTSITMSSCLMAGVNTSSITGAGVTMTGCTLVSPATCTIADGDLQLTINDCAAAIQWTADLVAGSTITTNSSIDVKFDVGDYSDINIDMTASAGFAVDPSTSAGTYIFTGLTTTGTVTLDNDSANDTIISVATALTYTDVNPGTGGGALAIAAPPVTVDFSVPNVIDGSRYRLYNVTQATELANGVIAGGAGYSVTLTRGTDYDNNDVVTFLATYQSGGSAKYPFRASATLTTGDFTNTDSQVDWANPGPNTLGIDGSTVSECATDYVGVQVEVTDADDTTQKARIAAFIVDALTTADGIRNWVSLAGNPVITYSTNTAAQVDAAVAAVEVINVKAASTLSVQDTFEFSWSDGVDRISAVLGSSILWLAPARVLSIAIGSGVTSQDKIDIANQVMSTTVENSESFVQIVRLLRAALGGLSTRTGSGPYEVSFRDAADTKDRIVATVDSSGQRTAITTDGT